MNRRLGAAGALLLVALLAVWWRSRDAGDRETTGAADPASREAARGISAAHERGASDDATPGARGVDVVAGHGDGATQSNDDTRGDAVASGPSAAAGHDEQSAARLDARGTPHVRPVAMPTGRVVGIVTDAATRRPLSGVTCMARGVDDMAIATTDDNGGYVIEDAVIGANFVACGEDLVMHEVEVLPDRLVHVDLAVSPAPHKSAGMLLDTREDQQIFVLGVVPGGAAARAGIRVGDHLVKHGEQKLFGTGPYVLGEIEVSPDQPFAITLERAGTPMLVTLTMP